MAQSENFRLHEIEEKSVLLAFILTNFDSVPITIVEM